MRIKGIRKKRKTYLHIRLRYIIVATMLLLFAGYVWWRAFQTTVLYAEQWNEKANKELMKMDTILPIRGEILACDGSVLATNLIYYTARIDFGSSRFMKKEFSDSLNLLCDTLAARHPQYTWQQWHDRLHEASTAAKPSHCFLLLRNLSYTQAEALKKYPFFRGSKNKNKTGLTFETSHRRSYPYGDMARRSVGRVGQTKASKEVHGISGLEYALDSLLYGKPGRYKKVPLTHRIENWTDVPATDGYTLTTTIDVAMQDIVEHELTEMLMTTEAEWGTAILMEVATGDIKAISNLERDTVRGTYGEAMNYALQGYEPGSVMKVISMTVAVEDGFVTDLDQVYSIPGGYVFGGGNPIRDTHSPSTLTVRQFLEYSSNIGMTKLVAPHFTDDPNAFRERLRKMGFLDRLNTGIAGEHPPYFPPLDKKSGGLTSLGRQTYGYASQIPPLYTCAFYNALANDGKFVRPRIYKRISNRTTDSILEPSYVREQMCSPQTAAKVREMMKRVIYEPGGTAKMLRNDYVELAGKTGTSKIVKMVMEPRKIWKKIGKDRRDSVLVDTVMPVQKGYTNSLRLAFCGFFPYENPKYTCMVLISKPSPGYRGAGYTSGMVFKNIALKMFSRGMLGNSSDFNTGEEAKGARPTVHASTDRSRTESLKGMLGVGTVARMRTPPAVGGVPDVKGMSVRDAIVVLENKGYNVRIRGSGYVSSQTPAPGTAAKRGTKVTLTLAQK